MTADSGHEAWTPRERRLLRALSDAAGDLDTLRTTDSVLITPDGIAEPGHWRERSLVREVSISDLTVIPLGRGAELSVYRLDGPLVCSTVWQRAPSGWMALIHQQSP